MANPVAPYYQRYDRFKKYVQLLAIPGRVAQASEFNDMGALFLDYMASLGNAIFSDGNIVSGCQISITDNVVTVTKGSIYIEGLVLDVEEQTFDIKGSGDENICVYVEETIVTESEDTSLYDPASGTENFGQPGCHARKREVKFGVDIPDSVVVWKVRDGSVVNTNEGSNEYEAITNLLARRTYDESGNYRVSGLQMSQKGTMDDDTIDITLSEGKAYVLGYEVNKPVATTFKVSKATTSREISGETWPMSVSNVGKTFELSNHPVSEIDQITVTLSVTVDMTRGAIAGGTDYLPYAPVFDIDEVKQGGTVYTRGVDWQRSGNAIDWSLLGTEPAIGSKYTVKYRYNKTLSPDDYMLTVDYAKGKSVVTLVNDTPVTDSLVYFNYKFYLARKDTVLINKNGEVVVEKGEPEILSKVMSPTIIDDTMLSIGTITVPPNQTNLGIVNLSIEASTMDDIQKTINRVDDLEYNQAVTDLDKEAEDGEAATQLKGILTDKFIGFSKADTMHSEWDAAIDLDSEELTLPAIGSIVEESINDGAVETSYSKIGTTITAPYTEKICISQPYASQIMLVNPYAVFDPMVPVRVIPNVDNWIENTHMLVTESKVSTTSLRRWWWHGGSSWVDSEKQKWHELGFSDAELVGSWDNKTKTKTSVTTDVLNSAIPYIRRRTVKVEAHGFAPLSDNIEVYFDDRLVEAIPAASEFKATLDGKLKANGVGTVKGTFVIPANVPCGSKSVKVVFAGDSSSIGKTGNAVYTANGRLNTIKTTILKETVIVKTVDPLAQSFQLADESYLTSVNLYFSAKDPQLPVTVQVRNMVNGYPGNIAYAEAIVPSDEIQISEDGSVATNVKFSNAVKCLADTQYCIVIMSDSNLYSMWVAKLGEYDVKSKKRIVANPYTAGVLFSSSNALTWSAHQDMDLKIDILRANYSGKGVLVFNEVPTSQADRILLAVDAITPSETTLNWFYKINGAGSWMPIGIFDEREVATVASRVALKAEFTAQPTKSPMISAENLSLAHFLNKQEARYISRNVHLEEGFNNIKVVLDVTALQNTGFHVYYSTDVDGTQWTELTSPQTETVDEEFVRYTWNTSVSKQTDFRIKIVLNTSNVLYRPRAKRLMCILKNI